MNGVAFKEVAIPGVCLPSVGSKIRVPHPQDELELIQNRTANWLLFSKINYHVEASHMKFIVRITGILEQLKRELLLP